MWGGGRAGDPAGGRGATRRDATRPGAWSQGGSPACPVSRAARSRARGAEPAGRGGRAEGRGAGSGDPGAEGATSMAGAVGRGLVAEGVGRGGRRHWVPSAGILGSPAGALGVAGGPGSPRGHAEAPGYQWLSDSGATPRCLRVSHACPPCRRPGRRRGAAACLMRVESCRAQRLLNPPWSSGGPQWGRGTRARVHRGRGSCSRQCRGGRGRGQDPTLQGIMLSLSGGGDRKSVV